MDTLAPNRPRVVLHNLVSVDGRIDGFPLDIWLYYETLGAWTFDAHLAGADTLLDNPPDGPDTPEAPAPDPNGGLLVVPDSRGRLRCWGALQAAGHWGRFISLCSRSTPPEHREYLRSRNVETLEAGDDHVDLAAALGLLADRYGVTSIALDSGGTLNGVMLRAGLVDEVSVIFHPALAGEAGRSFVRGSLPDGVALRLLQVETLRDENVWLRYAVVRP